jgi:cytochrome c peroxidase
MKMRSLELLAVIAACSSLVYACSSDDPVPVKTDTDAGSGGESGSGGATGGKATTGGRGATGGAATGGGGGATTPDSGPDGAPEAAAGGAGGGGGAGGAGGAGGGAGGGGAGGGGGCPSANALQCTSPYPAVPYPAENKHSDKKALLGKILFWDEQMGELDTMACGTCHRGAAGGSDPRSALAGAMQPGPNGVPETQPNSLSDDIRGGMGTPVCKGRPDGGVVAGTVQVTQRKPPSYLDAMFSLGVFWDGRAGYCGSTNTVDGCFLDPDTATVLIQGQIDPVTQKKVGGALEAQSVGPPLSSVEMACSGQTWPKIHDKLKNVVPLALGRAVPSDMNQFIVDNHNRYPEMFAAAFGSAAKVNASDLDDVINTRRIAYAIATHERRLTSDQTPWDKWNAGDNGAMTARQIQGFSLFMGKAKCGVCHTPPLFTDLSFHFIGFHDPNIANNQDVTGLEKITGNAADKGKFKTPSLRNVGLREAGGLLHSGDGPGHDLRTVMEMYKAGGRRTETAILSLIDGQLAAVTITTTEIDDIIEFMRNGLTDPRVLNETAPFDRPKLKSEP